jgi:hypothetical protein
MIRLVTYRNFPLVDLQIERAYQRRCSNDGEPCRRLASDDEEELWRELREMRHNARRNSEWLRELAIEVQTLSVKRQKRRTNARRFARC